MPTPTFPTTTFAYEVASYLANHGIGTLAQDVFVGHFAIDPDKCTMVFGAGASPQQEYLDTQYTIIDVWCRSQGSQTQECEQRAYQIMQLLHQFENDYLLGIANSNYYVYYILATSNIQDMDRDNQQRKLLKLTFRCGYRDINQIS